jgi:lysophospholipase L1-like esterase
MRQVSRGLLAVGLVASLAAALLALRTWLPSSTGSRAAPDRPRLEPGAAALSLVGALAIPGAAPPTDIAIVGRYAYVGTRKSRAGAPEFVIVDISNPTVRGVCVDGNRGYLATTRSGEQLIIVDVTDKSSPVKLGSFAALGRSAGAAVASIGDRTYLGTTANQGGPEFYVLDVSTPAAPALRAGYEVGADVHAIDATGTRAFLATANAAKEFIELDVSAPDRVLERATYDVPGQTVGRKVDYLAGRLYGVTDDNHGRPDLFVWDVAPDGTLQLAGAADLGTDNTGLAVYGSRAFVTTTRATRALTVVDVAAPEALRVTATYDAGAPARGVAISDSLAYVIAADRTRQLAVVAPDAEQETVVGDVNGDGIVTISCLGDSNTLGFNPGRTSWCTLLGRMIAEPNWRVVNHAVFGATALDARWPDASEQLTAALAHDAPDAIVFAFGTNDVTWAGAYATIFHVPATPANLEPSIEAFKALYTRAEATGARAFVATTPPANDGLATRLDYTLYLNNRLRHEIPRQRLIDFYSDITVPGDFSDPLHLNESGEAKWAAAAHRKLYHRSETRRPTPP